MNITLSSIAYREKKRSTLLQDIYITIPEKSDSKLYKLHK